MGIGILALFTGKTSEIITLACFGALNLYIVSMIAFFALRKNEKDLERPFKVPFYPLFPALALTISVIALIAMSYYNIFLAVLFYGLIGLSFLGYLLFLKPNKTKEDGTNIG